MEKENRPFFIKVLAKIGLYNTAKLGSVSFEGVTYNNKGTVRLTIPSAKVDEAGIRDSKYLLRVNFEVLKKIEMKKSKKKTRVLETMGEIVSKAWEPHKLIMIRRQK